MRGLVLIVLACGCAPVVTVRPEPSARRIAGAGATFEDADLRAVVLLDAARAVELRLYNKTNAPLVVEWDELAIVGPDHVQARLAATADGALEPGARRVIRLPLVLPPAKRPVEARLELIVPTVVRGTPREYHYHVSAQLDRHWHLE